MREEFPLSFTDSYYTAENFARLKRVQWLSTEKQLSVAQIALAWVLHQDLDIYALVSPRSATECQANAAVFDIELSEEEIGWLNLEHDKN